MVLVFNGLSNSGLEYIPKEFLSAKYMAEIGAKRKGDIKSVEDSQYKGKSRKAIKYLFLLY
jgi:hypothetical protein